MIYLIDHGNGNNANLISAIQEVGLSCQRVRESNFILSPSDRLILPGVGAFPAAVKQLKKSGLWEKIIESVNEGHPLLGICLGFQLLFQSSSEFGKENGFGFLDGDVVSLGGVHMGWNSSNLRSSDLSWYYYAHSYGILESSQAVLWSHFKSKKFVSSAQKNSVRGFQFHPERSGPEGLSLLHSSLA